MRTGHGFKSHTLHKICTKISKLTQRDCIYMTNLSELPVQYSEPTTPGIVTKVAIATEASRVFSKLEKNILYLLMFLSRPGDVVYAADRLLLNCFEDIRWSDDIRDDVYQSNTPHVFNDIYRYVSRYDEKHPDNAWDKILNFVPALYKEVKALLNISKLSRNVGLEGDELYRLSGEGSAAYTYQQLMRPVMYAGLLLHKQYHEGADADNKQALKIIEEFHSYDYIREY